MEKKLYQNPEMEVIKLKNNQALLAGSGEEAPGCLGDGGCDDGD